MARILAIDYGRKRVGLAVTDEERIIAGPLDTVPAHEVMNYLIRYVGVEKVDCFVVGEAVQLDGSPSESARFIEPFVKALRKQFPGIPVERLDERYTSKLASRAIAQAGLRKKDKHDKALVDRISAAILLQSYLDYLSYTNH